MLEPAPPIVTAYFPFQLMHLRTGPQDDFPPFEASWSWNQLTSLASSSTCSSHPQPGLGDFEHPRPLVAQRAESSGRVEWRGRPAGRPRPALPGFARPASEPAARPSRLPAEPLSQRPQQSPRRLGPRPGPGSPAAGAQAPPFPSPRPTRARPPSHPYQAWYLCYVFPLAAPRA